MNQQSTESSSLSQTISKEVSIFKQRHDMEKPTQYTANPAIPKLIITDQQEQTENKYYISMPTPKIHVDPKIMTIPDYHQHLNAIQNVWNSLPDYISEYINRIQINKGDPHGEYLQTIDGFWDPNNGEIYVNLFDYSSTIAYTIDTFVHEVGHLLWNQLDTSFCMCSSFRIERYIQNVIKIGEAPTLNTQTYLEKMKNISMEHEEWHDPVEIEETKEFEMKYRYLATKFANEVHSDMFSLLQGTLEKHHDICSSQAVRNEFITAINDLWDENDSEYDKAPDNEFLNPFISRNIRIPEHAAFKRNDNLWFTPDTVTY